MMGFLGISRLGQSTHCDHGGDVACYQEYEVSAVSSPPHFNVLATYYVLYEYVLSRSYINNVSCRILLWLAVNDTQTCLLPRVAGKINERKR